MSLTASAVVAVPSGVSVVIRKGCDGRVPTSMLAMTVSVAVLSPAGTHLNATASLTDLVPNSMTINVVL